MARTAKLSSACLLEGGLNRFSFVLFLFALFFFSFVRCCCLVTQHDGKKEDGGDDQRVSSEVSNQAKRAPVFNDNASFVFLRLMFTRFPSQKKKNSLLNRALWHAARIRW